MNCIEQDTSASVLREVIRARAHRLTRQVTQAAEEIGRTAAQRREQEREDPDAAEDGQCKRP